MKTEIQKRYVCEICGCAYGKKKDALLCERDHFRPIKVLAAEYDTNGYPDRYPESVIIESMNGDGERYRDCYVRISRVNKFADDEVDSGYDEIPF